MKDDHYYLKRGFIQYNVNFILINNIKKNPFWRPTLNSIIRRSGLHMTGTIGLLASMPGNKTEINSK